MTDITIPFHLFQILYSIHFRHHNVTDHNIRQFTQSHFKSLTTVTRFKNHILPGEYATDKMTKFLIILNNKNPCFLIFLLFYKIIRYHCFRTGIFTIGQNKFGIGIGIKRIATPRQPDKETATLTQFTVYSDCTMKQIQ